MKKFLLFLFISGFAGSIPSQNLNIARHIGIDDVGNILSINSKCYYWETGISNCCGHYAGVNAMSSNGNLLWTKSFQKDEYNTSDKLLKTPDKCLALLSHSEGCDTGPTIYYLTKFDTLGTTLFQDTVAGMLDLVCVSDSSFYGITYTDLIHYSKSGQFLSQQSTSLTNLCFIAALPNGHLVLSGTLNSQWRNLEITTSGSLVAQQASIYPLRKILPTVGSIFIAKNSQGQLESYTSNLSLITNSGFTVSDYDVRNDSIFTVGNSYNPTSLFYKIYDLNFNSLYQSSVPYKNLTPTSIALDDKKKINVITRGSSTPYPAMSFSGYYQFSITGGFESKSDIGIINSSVLSVSYTAFSNNLYNGTVNMNVTVKNFGTDTIHNFYLNHYAKFMWCYSLFHKNYTTQILPGATVQVNTGDFELNTVFNNTPNLSSILFPVCLFTSIPNESNDIEIANDARCDTLVYLLTGLDEKILETNVKIFPNPFNESLKIQSEFQIKTIELTNAIGSVIQTADVQAKNYTLQNSELKEGIYFLKIVAENGTIVKKIIKVQ